MIRLTRTLLPLALAAALPALAQEIKWTSNYQEALAQAKKSKKRVLVDFYADWCGPCKQMDKTTFKDPEVVKVAANFITVRINVDKQKDVARKFDTSSIPRVYVLSPDGKIVRASLGYQQPQQFALFLRQNLP